MHTSVCFKTVIKCKIATYWRFKFKDFSRTFKYFQAPYLFSSTFKGLEFFFKIQAFSRISQAHYEPCKGHSYTCVVPWTKTTWQRIICSQRPMTSFTACCRWLWMFQQTIWHICFDWGCGTYDFLLLCSVYKTINTHYYLLIYYLFITITFCMKMDSAVSLQHHSRKNKETL